MHKLMITNGGSHPADKWADATVEAITSLLVDGNPDDASAKAQSARQAKRELTPKLFAIFNVHHEQMQSHSLTKQSVSAPIDVIAEAKAALSSVNAVLAKTPFAEHFARPDVQAILFQIIGQHSTDVIHIERLWADKKVS